jgi:hypothetical protein
MHSRGSNSNPARFAIDLDRLERTEISPRGGGLAVVRRVRLDVPLLPKSVHF